MDFKVPERVWLIGKGPGIDTYDFSDSGWRCGINEAAILITCHAAIAIDYNIQDKYRNIPLDPMTVVFQKDKHKDHYLYANNSVVYFDFNSHCKLSVFATAPIAIQVLWHCGARVFHFVGFDSYGGCGDTQYADSVKAHEFEGTNCTGFRHINEHIHTVVTKLGITCIWEHLNEG